jgi:chromosome segregation ATPase
MMSNFSTKRVLSFPSSTAIDGNAAVDLVYQAADLFRDLENRANENAKYAQTLAEKAVEKLQQAGERIQELEAERETTRGHIDEANVMVREAAEALKLERSRVKAAEEQLRQLEVRVRNAEARAEKSGNALTQVEHAIRTRLLGQGRLAA